jgi:MFS family permease
VLVAPIVGPLSGAALMHFIHWKALFGIIAAMGFIAWLGLLLTMPETVRRGDVPFSAGRAARFPRRLPQPHLLSGAATLSLSYIPLMSWVAVSPVILMDAGGLTTSEFAWVQVPVFSAVIIANLSVARWVKDPRARALCSARSPSRPSDWRILIVRQSGMAARLALVGAGDLLLLFRHRADFPDAVPLYPVFQRSAEGHGLRVAEYRDPQRQRAFH